MATKEYINDTQKLISENDREENNWTISFYF